MGHSKTETIRRPRDLTKTKSSPDLSASMAEDDERPSGIPPRFLRNPKQFVSYATLLGLNLGKPQKHSSESWSCYEASGKAKCVRESVDACLTTFPVSTCLCPPGSTAVVYPKDKAAKRRFGGPNIVVMVDTPSFPLRRFGAGPLLTPASHWERNLQKSAGFCGSPHFRADSSNQILQLKNSVRALKSSFASPSSLLLSLAQPINHPIDHSTVERSSVGGKPIRQPKNYSSNQRPPSCALSDNCTKSQPNKDAQKPRPQSEGSAQVPAKPAGEHRPSGPQPAKPISHWLQQISRRSPFSHFASGAVSPAANRRTDLPTGLTNLSRSSGIHTELSHQPSAKRKSKIVRSPNQPSQPLRHQEPIRSHQYLDVASVDISLTIGYHQVP
ncbi:hypothetical protein QBC44DRAFT_306895 [Cladorrhinum sp. PSN332]|nr:hypothetical protein QBC44DRAFT_306895 [Cladorrhinum sp. PSN332]